MAISQELSANLNTADSSAIPSLEQGRKMMIGRLVDIWKPHHKKGLTDRLETGRELNEFLGLPSVRQDYGAKTLELVSFETGVSRSELSRMRKAARVISDLEAFNRDHPECITWTKVKAYLATVDEQGQPVRKKAKRTPPARVVCRSIKSLTKQVRGAKKSTPDDRQRVITALEGLAKAVSNTFGIALQVKTEQDSVSTTTDDFNVGASQAA